MKIRTSLLSALVLVLAIPLGAPAKNKKKRPERGMIERMEAVPCGAKQRGLTGLGSVFASIGVEHVNSDEKMCPQYLLRTDEMEYHIRPTDKKHPALLPVGHEGVFKIKKDQLYLKAPDGDRKTRSYHIVAMKPLNSEGNSESSVDTSTDKPRSKPNQKAPENTADPPPPQR